MDPFRVVKQKWEAGETREVEVSKIDKQIGVEYDSYRRVYIADKHEWQIVRQVSKADGKKYYILECLE